MASPHRGSRKTIDVLARAAVIYGVLIEQYDATRDELIARVRKALGPTAYGTAPEDALLRDVKWLKQLGSVAEFGIGRRVDQMGVALWRRLSCAGGDLPCL